MTLDLSIEIQVSTRYLDQQSDEHRNHYVFSYTITITNVGEQSSQLLSRHWVITDASGQVQEVKGPGVIGQQPVLQPGDSFEYTSGCILQTDMGTMQGSYQMRAQDGTLFDAPIGRFSLSVPRILH